MTRRGGELSPAQRQNKAEQSWGPHGDRRGDISEAMGQTGAQHQHPGRGMSMASGRSMSHLDTQPGEGRDQDLANCTAGIQSAVLEDCPGSLRPGSPCPASPTGPRWAAVTRTQSLSWMSSHPSRKAGISKVFY